jgi:uncharacterized membrane protein YjgN (DUF898 family)
MEEITLTSAEETANQQEPNTIQFNGNGVELLGIVLYNMVLTTLTIGLYYPWARVAKLKFLYQNTYLNGTPFIFSGTGKELFKGFIKFFAVLILFYAAFVTAIVSKNHELILTVYFVFLGLLLLIIPLAIHGALRYRLSRTSWRGIHFGYRGNRGKLIADYLIGSILTMLTLGIYQSWFTNNLRTYLIGNMRFGSLYFGYDGEGGELFWINFKGLFFSIITLGIYFFWYRTEYLNYFANHTYLKHEDKRHYLVSDYEGSDYFGLLIVNIVYFWFWCTFCNSTFSKNIWLIILLYRRKLTLIILRKQKTNIRMPLVKMC